ncbi:FAD/NAD(P)-binding protein [Streptomyces sp. NPDC048142]|uniref:FAD/NAD(P)-binding protein n=1 Tax=Streptomyces sp. NPDC048142 TaxID=3365501 RepID=UPI00371B87CB
MNDMTDQMSHERIADDQLSHERTADERTADDIAIIGGGAAAVAVLDRLARLPEPGNGRVVVFEPDGSRLWRGRAYQHDTDSVLVNILPAEMSATAGDPGAFADWLKRTGSPYGGGPWDEDGHFPPRHVFGSYLEHTAEQAVSSMSLRGRPVTVVHRRVTRVRDADSLLDVTDDSGDTWRFGHVICAVGPGIPADHYGLTGEEGFLPDPYPLADTLAPIPADAAVAVIGTGLAAVDTVVSLYRAGHTGPVVMASRNGCLPAIRQRPVHPEIRHFTPARIHDIAADGHPIGLEQLTDLLAEELRAHGADPAIALDELMSAEREDPLVRLRRQYQELDHPDTGMRVMQEAVPTTGPDAFPLLHPELQDYIRENLYRGIMSLCCPMPPENARVLLDMADRGQLHVERGLHTVKPRDGGGFLLGADRSEEADRVVNAVSAPAHRIPEAARAVFASLTEAEHAEYHPAGGIAVEPATSRATVDARPHQRLYAIGDVAGGTLFFTSGMPSIVDRAQDIVNAVSGTGRKG